MFKQVTDSPDWFQEYCMLVADVTDINLVDITDVNALWDLNQQ
jgi:hypothetical protein